MSARADVGAIGLRIRERRMAIGLTQEGLAKKLDVTAQAVSKWETGVGCPDIYVLPDIAQVLNMSVDELLGIQAVKLDVPEEEPVLSAADENAGEPAFFQEEADRAFAEAEKWVEENEPKAEAFAEERQEPGSDAADGVQVEVFTNVHFDTDDIQSEAQKQERAAEEDMKREAERQERAAEEDMKREAEKLQRTAEEVEKKITGIFGNSDFGANLSRYINSTVRSAMASVKKSQAWNSSHQPMITNAYEDHAVTLRGLDIDVSGSGEIVVDEGSTGIWEAKISAPEFMFEKIVCQAANGILYVKIPSISQFGYYGNSPKVRVAIQTGFSLGESLKLGVHGSADTQIHPDFERSEIRIAGSGDVEMENAGVLSYSVSGSGDLAFGDAQDASVRIAGSGDVHGGCLSGQVRVHISGSGDFSADAVSGTLEAVSAGSGDFSIDEGMLDALKIHTSGSGDFYGPNLEVEDAEVRITGGGDVVLGRVKGKLVQNISKSASVRIRRRG